MKIKHVTSIDAARSILKDRIFLIDPHIIDGDRELNAYIDRYPITPQQLTEYGATIILQWNGPVEITNNLLSGILLVQYFEYPNSFWRAHIRPPINENSLKIIGIDISEDDKNKYIEKQFKDFINDKWYRKFFCKNQKEKIKNRFIAQLKKDLTIDNDHFINFQ